MLQICRMDHNRFNLREAFVFSRSELRGLRILTLVLVLTITFRVVYFRCVAPVSVVFRIPEFSVKRDSSFSANSSLKKERENKENFRSEWNESSWSYRKIHADTVIHRTYAEPFRKSRILELNTADSLELRGLPAIGPWLARKIIEYRERLGGFYSPEQLLEVYRLTPGKLDTIWPFITVDTAFVRKIDVNRISSEELMKHPYLSRSQARGLIAYREKHGAFQAVADLKKCLLIDEKTFEKMRDYVEVR